MEQSLTTVMVSALVGAGVSYVGAVIRSLLATRGKIDLSLRDLRITAYKELWQKTALFPEWPRLQDVTYDKLHHLSCDFRDWYFQGSGMFLSTKAMNAYRSLQETITGILQVNKEGSIDSKGDHYTTVRDECSKLRSELTNDLLSRTRMAEM